VLSQLPDQPNKVSIEWVQKYYALRDIRKEYENLQDSKANKIAQYNHKPLPKQPEQKNNTINNNLSNNITLDIDEILNEIVMPAALRITNNTDTQQVQPTVQQQNSSYAIVTGMLYKIAYKVYNFLRFVWPKKI
jgi:hypothetical protein